MLRIVKEDKEEKAVKYNLSEIMRAAWTILKTTGVNMSVALKDAWASAKKTVNKKVFSGYTKMIDEEKWANGEMTFKSWKKSEKNRIYVSDPRGRSCYLEIINGEVFKVGVDARFERIVNRFLSTYEIAK